jgi:glycosyltransferase involved in cell wall biosynthesis
LKQGFVIPLYNHGGTIGSVISELAVYKAPVIVVDDGSDEETKRRLDQALAEFPQAEKLTLKKNSGKGAAVLAGMRRARDLGLSHVLQIDADGQHDSARIPFFLEEAARRPGSSICAYPEYDETAPKSRRNGRKIANTWARIVTLSGAIVDSLCGFRVYPVESSLKVMESPFLDKRMGFDPEVLVRLYWAGVPLSFFPVRVSYPRDGVSHFRLFEDNLHISWVFFRLFTGMLPRFPALLARSLN